MYLDNSLLYLVTEEYDFIVLGIAVKKAPWVPLLSIPGRVRHGLCDNAATEAYRLSTLWVRIEDRFRNAGR